MIAQLVLLRTRLAFLFHAIADAIDGIDTVRVERREYERLVDLSLDSRREYDRLLTDD